MIIEKFTRNLIIIVYVMHYAMLIFFSHLYVKSYTYSDRVLRLDLDRLSIQILKRLG